VADCISVQQGDSARIDFSDATFDLVVAIGVMPWTTEAGLSLKQMARVAKPDAAVLVTTDNRWAAHRVLDPRLCPPIIWVKKQVTSALSGLGWMVPKARAHTHSIRAFDRMLRGAELVKTEGRTLGFGPFSFWNREWLGAAMAASLHYRLQSLADRGWVWIRNRGGQYIVLARRQRKEST
jgi:SAM-dependent methyltransferase